MDHVLYDLLKFVDHVLYALCCLICGSCQFRVPVSFVSFVHFQFRETTPTAEEKKGRAQIETKLWLGRLIALSVEGPRAGSVFSLDYYHGKSIYCHAEQK